MSYAEELAERNPLASCLAVYRLKEDLNLDVDHIIREKLAERERAYLDMAVEKMPEETLEALFYKDRFTRPDRIFGATGDEKVWACLDRLAEKDPAEAMFFAERIQPPNTEDRGRIEDIKAGKIIAYAKKVTGLFLSFDHIAILLYVAEKCFISGDLRLEALNEMFRHLDALAEGEPEQAASFYDGWHSHDADNEGNADLDKRIRQAIQKRSDEYDTHPAAKDPSLRQVRRLRQLARKQF